MNISNNFKSIFKTVIAAAVLSVTVAACSKDHGEPQQVAGLSIIHAWPDTVKLDFIVDNTRANDQEFHYNSKIDYLRLFPGTRRLSVTKKGQNKFLISDTFPMSPGKLYSIFVVDTLAQKKFLFLEDDLTAPEADKAKVRFINLSPGDASYDLGIEGKETDLFTNKLFKEYSNFANIETGENITFNIKDDATKEVKATLPNVKIEKGKIYTIYAKGLKDAAVDSLKLGAAIYTHE